jgi:hypothetical protein
MNKILDEPYLYGYVFNGGYHNGKQQIKNTLEDVADFICRNGMNGSITITTPMDELVLDTFGIYIDHCPDKRYLEQLKKVLIPKQMKIDGTLDIDVSNSVLFSKVELWTDNGNEHEFFVGGIPRDYDDLEGVDDFDVFMEEAETQEYRVHVSSYVYGEGETERASDEQLAEIIEKFENDEEWMSELTPLEDSEFTFDYKADEQPGMTGIE